VERKRVVQRPPEAGTSRPPGAEDDPLLSAETVGAYLVARGVFPSGEGVEARTLGGGISNVVLSVRRRETRVVVKQALPQLRVPDDWPAKRERAITEGEALGLLKTITPGSVPSVLDLDPAACALTIEEAPADWAPWKDLLLAGEADPTVARRLGELLGAWHSATHRDDSVARAFGDLEAFDQLRVDAYYRTIARRRPELATAVESYMSRMDSTRVCLVHGDYSPKNVLVGDRIWAIDFEVAHYGDPIFDVAFMLNHLLLKRLHVPASAAAIEACATVFLETYRRAVPLELRPEDAYLLGHVGCLMLARVEGKSPAEYLHKPEREVARTVGAAMLLEPPATLDDAFRTLERSSP
jgi:tRNA A-37 threonylcarbamoyl transferase component Bud32